MCTRKFHDHRARKSAGEMKTWTKEEDRKILGKNFTSLLVPNDTPHMKGQRRTLGAKEKQQIASRKSISIQN